MLRGEYKGQHFAGLTTDERESTMSATESCRRFVKTATPAQLAAAQTELIRQISLETNQMKHASLRQQLQIIKYRLAALARDV